MDPTQERYELLASVAITDAEQQPHSLALVSDGSLFYDGMPCRVESEDGQIWRTKKDLLEVLLTHPDTAFSKEELFAEGYLQDFQGYEYERDINLEYDFEGLGRIQALGGHLVRYGRGPMKSRYAFAMQEYNASTIKLTSGEPVHPIFNDVGKDNQFIWYGTKPIPLPTTETDQSGHDQDNSNEPTADKEKNNVPAESLAKKSVEFIHEAGVARRRLEALEDLSKELGVFNNIELLVADEIITSVIPGMQESVATIIARLKDNYPKMMDISDDELRNVALWLINPRNNSFHQYLPKRFALHVRLSKQERDLHTQGERFYVGNDRLFIERRPRSQ